MGFKISWKLIVIGLYGKGEIPPLITRFDVVDYFDGLLNDIDEQTDNIIALICEKEDSKNFDRLLEELANKDDSSIAVQKRKWRVCLLKNILDNVKEDCLQGLLELMEFWVSMGEPKDCPQTFPNGDDKKSIQEFFTPESYEVYLNKNREWINQEIKCIVMLES